MATADEAAADKATADKATADKNVWDGRAMAMHSLLPGSVESRPDVWARLRQGRRPVLTRGTPPRWRVAVQQAGAYALELVTDVSVSTSRSYRQFLSK